MSELLQSFAVAVVALTLLMVVAGAYEPVREGLPLPVLAKFVPLMIPYALPWTIPTAFVAACIMVYSRMAGDNELTAVRAAGIHLWRVLTPAAAVAVLLCAVCGVLNHAVVPRTGFYQYRVVKAVSASEQAAAIRFSDPTMRIGRYTIYMGEVEQDDTFTDIVVVMPERVLSAPGADGGQVQVAYIRAPRGHFRYSDDEGVITFYLESEQPACPDCAGREFVASPGGLRCGRCGARVGEERRGALYKVIHGTRPLDFESATFGSCAIPIRVGSMADISFLPSKGKHMTTLALMLRALRREQEIRGGLRRLPPDTRGMSPGQRGYALKRWHKWRIEPRFWRTAVHKRSALALAPLLLGAIAVPLGALTRRGRRLVAFGLAIGIVLGAYYPMMAAGSKLGESGILRPAVAVWSMTGVVALAGFVLVANMFKR